ncbi:ATPase [Acrocarpospora corrugata]|uniref:histidine kinase n=1 Tax=Acrocarpospora corrugata TaxID=35763 RepID=A0A5M3W0Q8_9ACTN|nr:histidine kinase [Acrocarpospora corrugata]GES02697.1 ATPase [Acrocarpospora corrugata]
MAENEPRRWRQLGLELLRSEKSPALRSRRGLIADVSLAITLTILALVATAASVDGAHLVYGAHHVDGGSPSLIEPLRLPPGPEFGKDATESADTGLLPLLVILTTLPLAVRRLYPLSAFWAVLLAALATHDDVTWIIVLSCAVAVYSAVAYSPHRVPAIASLMLAAVLAGAAFNDVVAGLPSWLGPFVVLLSAGAIASFVRFWQKQLSAHDAAMRRAVEVERARIASELHDVVTHNVNVMVIQAGAARKVMDAAPDQSKQALLAVEASGRAAMAELRHVMGLLAGPESTRADGMGDGLEPQPGLDQLDALVERVRAAGVPVSVEVRRLPGPLPPGVDLAAYRVVQEALTNTIKHAAGSAVSVTIGHSGGWLEIEVADTGSGRQSQPRAGAGSGLIGLRERLAIYGGTLHAGPKSDGGYRTSARVPWAAV